MVADPALEVDRQLAHQPVWSACYAPLTSMYFDQFGKVRACCQNTDHLLGDVTEHTIREIWDGQHTQALRRSLRRGHFDRGCGFCAWQMAEVGPVGSFARSYDYLVAENRRPRWPVRMEFSVTNTCNLQCVMCNGDWSSAIRSQREGRSPLRSAYDERFFAELREFIPHLQSVVFTGGEPFLGREPLRIMELLLELRAPDLKVVVVTNGTVLTPRVERILHDLPIEPTVSIDGGTPEVYERIRVGASFASVVAHLETMVEIAAHHGLRPRITHCLMVDNWETFPELLGIAERLDLVPSVNVVRFPAEHSLYQLPTDALTTVVAGLTAREAEVERTLTGPRLDCWRHEVAALRGRLAGETWPEALGIVPEERGTPVSLSLTRRRD